MKIFSVGNKANVGFWCAAPDARTAIAIAFAAKHAKALTNLRATDVTEHFLKHDPRYHDMATIEKILNGEETGRVIGLLRGPHTIQEVMAALANPRPPRKTQWVIAGL